VTNRPYKPDPPASPPRRTLASRRRPLVVCSPSRRLAGGPLARRRRWLSPLSVLFLSLPPLSLPTVVGREGDGTAKGPKARTRGAICLVVTGAGVV
jgi:hypothetical protein